MGLISVPADGAGAIAAGARAGQILQVNDAGVLVLAAPHPPGQLGGHYSVYENGAAGGLNGVGLNEFLSTGIGAGAVRTPLTSEAGWFNGSGSIETGTTTTGQYSLGGSASIQFSSISGTWFYELTFSIPVLSDGTNTYTFQAGFVLGDPITAGAVAKYTHSVNGGRFQFSAVSAGVATTVDSGITLVAGNYYHLRVEIVNNNAANFWLITTFAGGTWSDTGVWGAPLATISSNVPTGSGDRLFGGLTIKSSAGTTSKKLKYGYVTLNRIPPFTRSEPSRFIGDGLLSGGDGVGQALGAKGTALGLIAGGVPGWSPPNRIQHPIQFHAYGRAGFVGPNPHDFGLTFGGTAGSGAAGAECVDNSLGGTTGLITNFIADGFAAQTTAIALKLDATVNPLVFETVWSTTVLSTGGAPFNDRAGFFDSVAAAPTNGIFVEMDGSVSAAIQCKVRAGGVTTTVSTGITIVANTYYFVRIIATATSVSFFVAADDAGALTTPIVITTNIPTGVAMCAADIVRSTGAVALNKLRIGPVLAYSRSST